jgi:hypothetical protein
MKEYEIVNTEFGEKIVFPNEDGILSWIPKDLNNNNYVEYLKYKEWVESGKDVNDFWYSEGGIDVSS